MKNILECCGGIGAVIAVTVSWSINKSILWCIAHGLFGWCYVIYYAMGYGRN